MAARVTQLLSSVHLAIMLAVPVDMVAMELDHVTAMGVMGNGDDVLPISWDVHVTKSNLGMHWYDI
ncbi:hypothetical protein PENSTE_c018G05209 [Penicillium steckii]|uniref:Uncharacterized protein n=1 Tax=Penicillium steckii TaxID=303698 RepID=A0A1V6SWA7_9EURO|nr:hypothetical protein PENSTE_c018G05209 [Penicillium steckii]